MRAFKDAYTTNNQVPKGRLTAACIISHKPRAINFPLMYNQIKDTVKCIFEECSKLFPSFKTAQTVNVLDLSESNTQA